MLTLEKLRALRGCTSDKNNQTNKPSPEKKENPGNNVNAAAAQQQNDFMLPVEVPCKHYKDESGHFAYIDAHTHQPVHFNMQSGKSYTQAEVNQLSLSLAAKNITDAEKTLTWEQVITDETLYDKFGSPVIGEEDVRAALDKEASASHSEQSSQNQDIPTEDPYGFPI